MYLIKYLCVCEFVDLYMYLRIYLCTFQEDLCCGSERFIVNFDRDNLKTCLDETTS